MAAYEPAVFLIIYELIEHVLLAEKLSVVIGRADMKTGFQPDVDLTRYGAQKHGVSRAHARLHRHGAHFFIADLCSDNGTFIEGKRLTPDVPYVLGSGEELALGCLKVKVLFSQ
jgi:pSer/pThr/pTyr-binding forkhead associated (FHA) protein